MAKLTKSSIGQLSRVPFGTGGKKLVIQADGTGLTYDNNKIVSADWTDCTTADDPVLSEFDYTVAPGTTSSLNIATAFNGTRLGYWVLGAGQTILGPVGGSTGLNVACDQTDNEGLEVFSNWGPADGCPLSVGTDPAFYFKCKFKIATINGCDDLFVGFKKVELVNANMEDYNTYAGLGLNTAATPGLIKVRDELAGAGVVNTSTTQTIASDTYLTVEISVSAAGVTTFKHDAASPGFLAAPTTTHAFSFADGDNLVPTFRFLHANAAQAGAITIQDWEVGFTET